MPAIDISECCIPAECDNIKLPYNGEIASRWDANLLCDICRHFASVMLHFASLNSIISAYLPTHIKFLTEFHRIFFGKTCISFHFLSTTTVPQKAYLTTQNWISNNTNATHYYHTPIWIYLENTPISYIFAPQKTRWVRRKKRFGRLSQVIRVNSRTSHNNNQIFFNEK